MEHIIPTFGFGGHDIDVTVKELPQTVEFNLENIAGAPGSQKVFVLRHCLKSVRVDGQNRPLYRRDEEGDQVFTIPNIRERRVEKGRVVRKALSEELLRRIIEKNDFLALDERFEAVFGRYLPADEQDEGRDEERAAENPTVSPEAMSPEAASPAASSTESPSREGDGASPVPLPSRENVAG